MKLYQGKASIISYDTKKVKILTLFFVLRAEVNFIYYNFFQIMHKARKISKISDNVLNFNSQQEECKQILSHQKKIHKPTKNRKKHAIPAIDSSTYTNLPPSNIKGKVDEDNSNSTMNLQQSKSEIDSNPDFQLKNNIAIQDHLKFPKYISFSNFNVINGYFGHGTLVFKKPIIEGLYYFEVKILSSDAFNFPIKNPPSIRIGLCSSTHNLDIPLGVGNSLGYSSSKGVVVYDSTTKIVGEICKQGDVLGCSVQIIPPHKHRVQNQINQQNKVTFYKNGQPICKSFCELKNNFYHFGISLYNFARVQMCLNQNQMNFKPERFEAVSKLKSQHLYKDLKFLETA